MHVALTCLSLKDADWSARILTSRKGLCLELLSENSDFEIAAILLPHMVNSCTMLVSVVLLSEALYYCTTSVIPNWDLEVEF